MIELDLNPDFEAKLLTAHRHKNLSDIIRSCERAVFKKIKAGSGVTPSDTANYENLVSDFLCSYFSVKEEIEDNDVFSRERKTSYLSLVRNYSMYAASKAALNKINDEAVEQMRSEDLPAPTFLTYSDINKGSDYTLLENILKKLEKVPASNSIEGTKFSYFSFFDRLREMCKNYIRRNCHPETRKDLNQIQVYKTGLDFHELPAPEKKEFSKDSEKATNRANIENLPTELPVYEPNPNASLDAVVGNESAIDLLRGAFIRTLCYNPLTKSNEFGNFNNCYIVHGKPGDGKTFSWDALVNHYVPIAEKSGKPVVVADPSKGIKSTFKDRPAQVFERYMDIVNAGDKIWLLFIDEADGVFSVNQHGEMHQEDKKLLREMKKAYGNCTKGNMMIAFNTNYPEQFEAALKQRFTLVEMRGATTPEHFARLFKQELGDYGSEISDRQYFDLGKRIHSYKIRLDSHPVTGRSVKKIVAPFVSGDDRILILNEETLLKSSPGQLASYIPKLAAKAEYKNLAEAIDKHVIDLQKSSQQSTARYNKA